MIKKIAIYYFSGTGNTEIVAKLIEKEFLNRKIIVDLIRIEDILKNNISIEVEQYDLIGIGNPVIAFGSPKIIYNFIKALPDGKNKRVFIFKTAGGVAPVNYNASKPAIRRLQKKGYEVFYDRIMAIGSNWLIKYDERVMMQLYQTTKHKVKIMCEEIISGKPRIHKIGLPLSIVVDTIIFLASIGIRFIGKDFKVAKTCDLCGKCIKNCPVENIHQKNDKVKFNLSCLWCMRCIYNCPQNAIKHRLLSFCVVPGGYDINKTINNTAINPDCSGIKVPPFLHDYIQKDEL